MKAVSEAVVLGGVEDLEQDGGGRGAELVDLVEDEDGVSGAGGPQLAQDGAGLGVPPRSVVAAQVGVVVEPAAGELHEPAPEGLGRAPGQRSLPGPGRPGEAQYGAAAGRRPPPHGQVLEEARLGVAEAGVPGIERRPDAGEVDRRRRTPVPRQRFQPLDPVVGPLGAGLRRLAQAPALARDGVPHGRRQPVGGALAQHVPHDGRRDDLGRSRPRRPARQRLPADQGQLRVELRHARLVRVPADHLADRVGLEADDALGRGRPPRLGRVAGPGRQRLQLRR